MQLTLYDKNGREKARFSPSDSSTQTKEIQGDNVLGLSFTLYEFVAIDVNDYIDYEGERYRALEKYAPSEKSTVEWEYSVQFYGVESLIKRFLVLNTTDGDNEAVFTLTDKPSVHLALIVRCINEGMASMGTARWVAGAIANDLNAENVVIDYHGKYCDEALRELAEAVGSEWYVEGTTVSIGRCEFGEPLTLGYGEGKGLTSLDRDRADNAKFYTRLFPIGSSRNIDPSDYNGHTRLQLPGGAKFVDVNADEYGIIHHYEQEAFAGIYPRRIGEVSSVRSVQATSDDGTPYTIYYFKDNGLDFNPDEYMMAGKVLRVSFQDGEMAGLGESDDHYFEVNWHNDTREFEIITIWPYGNDIQLPGGNLIPKRGDHYILWNCRMPREYYGYAEAEFLAAVNAYNADHALDVSRYKGPTDHVWVEQKEAEAAAQGTGPMFYLGRRVRLESSEYFPDNGHRQSRITKITRKVTLPSQMDLEISNALSRTSLEKIGDDIGEARNYAATLFRGIAAPDLIRVGDGTKPTDNNLYSARRSHEEFVSRKADDTVQGFLTLLKGAEFGPDGAWGWVRKTGDVVKSWFKNLWTDILTVTNYLTGEGGLLTLKGNVSIAKDTPNGRNGNLSVAGDISGQNATMAGTLGAKNVNVSDTITTKNLRVEGSAYFWELVIDKIRAAGGAWLITPADGFTVEKVVAISGGYRLLWKASDGKKATRSQWVKGMQAICRTMNAAEGTNYNLSNKYYWALVTNAGTGTSVGTIDGETYHWIELSSSTKDPSCTLTPEEGDEIAQLGYRRQSASEDNKEVLARQSAIYIAAYQSIDSGAAAPVVSIYEGINDFELSKHRVSTMSPQLVEFLADRLRIVTGTGSSTTITGYINDLFDELDIPEGIDGVSVGIDPPEYIVTETYNAAYDTMDYDLSDGAELATVWARQGAENCPVQIMELTYDQTATTLSIGYNNRILFYGRDKMAAGNFKKLAVSVKARVTYTVKAATATTPAETATKDISLKFMLYVNRGGTTTMYTYNDLTRIIRERTAFAYDEQGIVREFAYKSDVTDAADRFSRQMSALPLARNLLLNSDFAAMAETANGCIHLVPTTFWQGYQQESRNAQGEWVNRLVGGATYTLSFYARGKGRVGAVVHHTLLAGDTSQGNQSSMLEYLTPKPKLFTMTFTPSANCPFRVMIGSNSYGIGEMPGTEIYISRPKLVRNTASTTNLLANPELGNVADGIPQGWTLWDNWESGSAAPVKTREIVPELYPPSTPVKWERWTNGDTGLSPSTNVGNLEDGVYPINIVPRSYWNGLAQRSYVREGADGWGGGAKVLKHDAWYTLSFEAKGTRSGVRAGFIIDCVNLASGSDKFGKTVGGTAFEWDLTTSWKRYTCKFKAQANYDTSATDTDGYGFSLMLGLVNAISETYTQNVIQIRRPQLEEGETATEWRRGEENMALMQTQFKQLSDRMELGVYRDGVKRSGMTLDEDGVEFDGERVKINGDLDLQGLTTENVKIVKRNGHESDVPSFTVVNMGVGASTPDEVVKSVQVAGNHLSEVVNEYTYSNHYVVLPFYDEIVTKGTAIDGAWNIEDWKAWMNMDFGASDGSFLISRNEAIPLSQRRVVEWKKNGTRLTVVNEMINRYGNWQSIPNDRQQRIASHANSLGGFVIVCADGRIMAEDNVRQTKARPQFDPSIASFGYGTTDASRYHGGCFSCGGYRARFIILLPGQSLQLRSQIISINGRKVLTWIVENPAEFVPYLPGGSQGSVAALSMEYGSNELNYLSGYANYSVVAGDYHAYYETILAPAVMNYRTAGYRCIEVGAF